MATRQALRAPVARIRSQCPYLYPGTESLIQVWNIAFPCEAGPQSGRGPIILAAAQVKRVEKITNDILEFEKKRKSHRQDLLATALVSVFFLSGGIFLSWVNSSEGHGKFIEPPIFLGWIIIFFIIILLLIVGFTSQDFIFKGHEIQLPRSKMTCLFYRPKLRKYSEINAIKIIHHQNDISPDSFSAEIQFNDGYVGIVNYWDLRNLGLSLSQTKRFRQFLVDLDKKLSANKDLIDERFRS